MESPKMQVKCSVENCHYNHNEQCHASALEVNPMSTMSNSIVETSNETSCKTFKPDESNYT
ncbi:MAG TPA: DUF1540 domain-containing protein [Epulopiscium sp.]|nr:DUF1540 domain-containing protein [Candidatus Epulonipiscium sp.]